MSRVSRDKGAAGEREIARIIRGFGWPLAKRTSRGVSQAGVGDIACGPAGYHIEVKRDERLSMEAALRQVRADCMLGQVPALVRRWNGDRQWWVTIPLEQWLAREAGAAEL